jgi:hypothetical protein
MAPVENPGKGIGVGQLMEALALALQALDFCAERAILSPKGARSLGTERILHHRHLMLYRLISQDG